MLPSLKEVLKVAEKSLWKKFPLRNKTAEDQAKYKEAVRVHFHELIEARIASADLKPDRFAKDGEHDYSQRREKEKALGNFGRNFATISGVKATENTFLTALETLRQTILSDDMSNFFFDRKDDSALGREMAKVCLCQVCAKAEYRQYTAKTGTAKVFCRDCITEKRVVPVRSTGKYELRQTSGLTEICDENDTHYFEFESVAYNLMTEYHMNRQDRCYYHPSIWARNNWHLIPPDSEVIGGYHSSKSLVGHIPSMYDSKNKKVKTSLLLGMELEVEMKPASTSQEEKKRTAAELFKLLGVYSDPKSGKAYRYCATEHDGSLQNGFEIVTGYTGLDVHEKQLAPLKEWPFKGRLRSHDTTTCGLHVHIDRHNMTPLHMDKLSRLINDSGNRAMILAIARRYGSNEGYATISDKKGMAKTMISQIRYRILGGDGTRRKIGLFDKKPEDGVTIRMSDIRKRYHEASTVGLDRARYQALNFTNENTVEYRLFKGTLKFETIMSCLEFTRLSWLFARDHGLTEMTTAKFVEYIMRPENSVQSKYLRPYLIAKGFIAGATLTVKDGEKYKKIAVDAARALDESVLNSEDAADGVEKPTPKKEQTPKYVRSIPT